MNFSLNYLKKMANLIPTTTQESIVNALNNLGFEVEGATPFVEGNKLVIGTIKSINEHPNADRLKILNVDIGLKDIQIVTGATNIKINKQVIVCIPGSSCNGVKYKTVKLRGVESHGMLASLNELGIADKYLPASSKDGIQLLESKYKNGRNALQALNLDDIILDIDLLSNRGDAHGYYFLATELSSYFNTKMNHNLFPKLTPSFKSKIKVKNGLANHISLLEGEVLEGESDFQTRLLLIKSNISPINKTVDLTNMALLLFGQPVHVYDQELVGNNLDCKLYTGNLKTINDIEIQVKKGLTIFSDDKPASVAGIIGLKNTMVTSKTKKVVFEIANFDPKYIRKTSKEIKIENTTTIRNSKSMSLNVIPLTINFLQNSLKKFSNVINELNIKEQTIFLEDSEIINYAGFDIIKHKEYKNAIIFLKNLGYKIDGNKYTTPYYRYDIENQFDIIEDIFRGFGYNNIPKVQPKILSSLISADDSLKQSLVHQNYTEIITYSLQDDKYNAFNPFGFNRNIKLLHPISNKRMTYRFTLIKSMAKIAIKNLKYKIEKFSLFEVGNINGYLVNKHLALLSTIKSLDQMKIDLLTILNPYGIVEFKRTNYEHLHEGMTADIFLDNKYVGFIGKFRPSYMKSNFLIAEIKLPQIKKLFEESKYIEKEQLIDRDWTVILDNKTDVIEVISKLKQEVTILYLTHIETFKKNDTQKAITFKIYLNKENAKIFDEIYK